VAVGDVLTARSIINSAFEVTLTGVSEIAGRPAVLPRISGRAWIHGVHQIGIDPTDPYPQGFMVADCWGDAFDLLK
jgi:proline racemase